MGEIMDQVTHNTIVFFIRGIETDIGLRSHFIPNSRTRLTTIKCSEFLRWR